MVVDYELSDAAIDRMFQALANATRRDLLSRAIRDEQSVSALARHYAMSFAGVQKHVAVLERAELVTKERHGREELVRGNREAVQRAAELLAQFEQLWMDRTMRIAEILEIDDEEERHDRH
jgi:DNA-binding transcriptional ArsR family regulator